MLSLFRTNQVIFNLGLLVYLIVLRISYFFNPIQQPSNHSGFFSGYLQTLLEPPLYQGIAAILLLFSQAVLLNYIAMKHRLFQENTLFPGLFYILSTSILQDFFPLSTVLFGNLFLIITLDQILSTYKKHQCADNIFNAGFWVSIASLFYPSFSFFFLLALMSLGFLRVVKWKEVLILLIGFLVPFLFISTWYFWQDGLQQFWQSYFVDQFSFFHFQYEQSRIFLVKVSLLVLLFLLGFFHGYEFKKTNQIRNYVQVIYLTLIISGITFLFQPSVTILHFLIIMVPLSFLLTARFLAFDKSLAEIVHAILFICILFFQYQGFESLFG